MNFILGFFIGLLVGVIGTFVFQWYMENKKP